MLDAKTFVDKRHLWEIVGKMLSIEETCGQSKLDNVQPIRSKENTNRSLVSHPMLLSFISQEK